MPSSKLSELLQLAKEKSKLGDILFNSESTNTFTWIVEEEESDGEFSNKSMDHDSAAADETGTNTNYLSGFDAESMQNARKFFYRNLNKEKMLKNVYRTKDCSRICSKLLYTT